MEFFKFAELSQREAESEVRIRERVIRLDGLIERGFGESGLFEHELGIS